jgi:ribonuclease J
MDLENIHTSGHADLSTLNKMLCAVQPKLLIPIHTMEANQYQDFFPEFKVKMVNDGEVADRFIGLDFLGKMDDI